MKQTTANTSALGAYRLAAFLAMVVLYFALVLNHGVEAQTAEGWAEPINLSKSGSASNPQVVLDTDGVFHILWSDEFAGFVYTTGDGNEWSTPVPVSLPSGDFIPILLADREGNIHAFWRDDTDALFHSRVRASSFATLSSWNAAVQITDSALDVDVIVDDQGRIHLAYVRPKDTPEQPAGIYYQRLRTINGNWSLPIALYQSPYLRALTLEDSNVDLSSAMVGDEVRLYAVWDNQPRERVFLSVSFDGGESWSEAQEIDKPQEGSVNPGPERITTEALGEEVFLFWQKNRMESSCEQYYQISKDGGSSWGPPLRMFEGFVICPQEIRFLPNGEFPILFLTGIQVYLQAWNGSIWSDPQPQEAINTFIDPETQNFVEYGCQQPILVGEATLYVVGCDRAAGQDIWLMRRQLLDVSTWFPQEAIWNPLVKLTISDTRVRGEKLVADRQERLHAFWSQASIDQPQGQGKTIYYARWEAGQWSTPAAVLTSPEGNADQPDAIVDGQNRLHVVWSGGLEGQVYYSRADANQAVVATAWADPLALPAPRPVGSAPDIHISPEGIIYVAYAIPLNEDRGIYLTRSDDGGDTWTDAIRIFDAQSAGWAMVDQPHLALTDEGQLHLIFTRYSLPGGTGPLSLVYMRSVDGGKTWGEPQTVVDNPVIWSWMTGTGKSSLQRLWQEISSSGTTLWHEQSLDNGTTWFRTVPVSIFGGTIGTPSLIQDDGGRLHLLLVVRGGTTIYTIQHWLFDGQRWSAERSFDIEVTQNTSIESLACVISPGGKLGVIIKSAIENVQSGGQQSQLLFTYRDVDISSAVTTPIPTATNTPPATPLPTYTRESETTSAATEVVPIVTNTPPIFAPGEENIGGQSGWLSGVLPVAIVLIVVIGVYVAYSILKKRFW